MTYQKTTTATPPPGVSFSELNGVRSLHLGGTPWIQGSMWLKAPFDLALIYVQRMMGGLLFLDLDEIPQGRAMQLGLGAAALTKFCYQKLGMHTTAIELNTQVVSACRQWFALPPDDERLQVVLANAAQQIRRPAYEASVDLLHVDLYDREAAAPVLDSAEFYADCARLLAPHGVMAVNLFGRNMRYAQSLAQIVQVFGAAAVWEFAPTREGNVVVLAQRHASRPTPQALQAQALAMESRWKLPAQPWLEILTPVLRL